MKNVKFCLIGRVFPTKVWNRIEELRFEILGNFRNTGGPPLVRSQLVRIPLVRIFKKLSWNSTCTIFHQSPPLVRIQLIRNSMLHIQFVHFSAFGHLLFEKTTKPISCQSIIKPWLCSSVYSNKGKALIFLHLL